MCDIESCTIIFVLFFHLSCRYQVRYHALDAPAYPLDKYTPTNFVIIDNLRPNTRYVYKLKRLGANGQETGWSDIGLLDTSLPDNTTD